MSSLSHRLLAGAFAALAAVSHATGTSFCKSHSALTSCLQSDSSATSFCSSYLQATVTERETSTPVTTTSTTTSTTATSVVTLKRSGTGTSSCSRTTLTPYTETYTIPGEGTFTYTFTGPNVRREELYIATAAPTPSCFSGKPAATISAGCSCLGVKASTSTTTEFSTAPTSTATKTITKTVKTVTSTSTSYSAIYTSYFKPNTTYTTNGTQYEVYSDYRFNFDTVDVTFYSCEFGLCGLEPAGCPIKDCTNGLTDCLRICAKYVANCTAVLYERDDINDNKTCAFIDTRTNPLSCGYGDNHDDFGVQKGFLK